MTIVIAVATHPFVALLTDRRITTPTSRGTSSSAAQFSYRDTDTKSVIMNGRYALGFAGLGTVGAARQRMEFWLMNLFKDRLTEKGLEDWPEFLAEEFGKKTEQVGFRGEHHFVAPGYYLDHNGDLKPEIISIANQVFPNTFDVARHKLEGTSSLSSVIAGADPPAQALDTWKNALDEVAKSNPMNLSTVIDAMLDLWASTSACVDSVGPTAICTTFPRSAVPLPSGLIVRLDEPTSDAYVSSEVSSTYALDPVRTKSLFEPARISVGIMAGGAEIRFSADDDELGFIEPLDRTRTE